jgi:HEAT repeat protein
MGDRITIEQLIEEFSTATHDRLRAVREKIIQTGAPTVPFLVRAYRAKKIDMWDCFKTILEMEPAAYGPVLEAARDDNDEALAILAVVANHRRPPPEAVPVLIDGLGSVNGAKVYRCLEAIAHIYPLIEVDHPEQLPHFARATNHLLDLLHHENDAVRTQTVRCMAVLKPEEPDVLPVLLRTLRERDPVKNLSEVQALLEAIGTYGSEAAEAVPVLAEILQSPAPDVLWTGAAHALAAIGPTAASTVALLEERRDKTELRFKSRTQWFKRQMNQAIKSIQRAAKPPVRKAVRRGDPHLLDLIKRMGQSYDPAGTSGKAYGESRKLSDASLIPQIADLLDTRLSCREFGHLVYCLGWVTHNTDSADGRRLILSLLSRDNLRRQDINALIVAATTCSLKEASPMIRQVLCRDRGCHVWDALEFFKAVRDDTAIDDIARCMEEFPRYSMFCIPALANIGSPRAVPRLLEIARGNLPPAAKAKWQQWRHSAIAALGQLGDPGPVPDLISMLSDRNHRSYWPTIVDALCLIGDERGFVPVLATLRRIIERQVFAKSWSASRRTIIVNSLDYLNKIGRKDDPFVIEVVETLRSGSNWNRLLEQERRFIEQWYPVSSKKGG